MELALNLAWTTMAILLCLLWACHAPFKAADRRTQLVALALVILIMFPVISATDDLILAQNPAETSTGQRRDHMGAHLHFAQHPVADAHLAFPVDVFSGPLRLRLAANPLIPRIEILTLDSVQNRPPPAA